jgi:hypothetical protein
VRNYRSGFFERYSLPPILAGWFSCSADVRLHNEPSSEPPYVSFRQIRMLAHPFPPVGPVAAPCGSPAVPHLPRYYGLVRSLSTRPHPLRSPAVARTLDLCRSCPPGKRGMKSCPGFLANRCENMPRARDTADPDTPSHERSLPGAAFRHRNGVGIGKITISVLILTACFLTVYASTRRSPGGAATLVSDLPARLWSGGNYTH